MTSYVTFGWTLGNIMVYLMHVSSPLCNTVEPRFNESIYNEVFGITNDFPGSSNSEMYGREHRYNENSLYPVGGKTTDLNDDDRWQTL